ncbi:MAG: tetratricopeptide repeat protein [Armatimonadota bacterium]
MPKKKSIEERLDAVAKLEQGGHIREAVDELKRALRSRADRGSIYARLAELYRAEMRMDDAIDAAKSAVAERPSDYRSREFMLELLLEAGRLDEVIAEARKFIAVHSRSLAARDVLGIAYLQKGMIDSALSVTNEMIKINPTSPANHFKKAVLYQQKGELASAIQEFARVLEMQPDLEMAARAERAINALDTYQLRNIVSLAVEDYIFRTKLIHDPETAALERGYYLSGTGMDALRQIRFDQLPEIYSDWKQRYYH